MKQIKRSKTLVDYFKLLPDFRRGQGKMHKLTTVLLIVTMAIMSGYYGQRATGDFVQKHREELIKVLKPKNKKLPSYQTIARIMQHLNYDDCAKVFFAWAKTIVPLKKGDWVSTDGKAIGGTVCHSGTPQQQFTNLVSLFANKSKQVLTQGKVTDKTNEIPMVVQLIRQLGLTGLVITADALHCQKNTVSTIVSSRNDYCIGVKGNQTALYEQLKKIP